MSSELDQTPQNHNYLSPHNFTFTIKKAPHVNFFIQKVNIPSVDLPAVNTPNPFVRIPVPGEHITYGNLNINFKVDEDLQNYMELYNWIVALGKPKDFYEYKVIEEQPKYSGNGIYSDISVMILSNIKNPNWEVVYKDAFPISLSEINFDTTIESDISYITATASFRYTLFDIQKVV